MGRAQVERILGDIRKHRKGEMAVQWQRHLMKESTKDRVQGKTKEIQGQLKEAAGVLTGSDRLKNRGRTEQLAGKLQKKAGQVERVLGG